ncbi:RluA family pseudouridine synthase [Sphingomonas sp. HF-S4]|uniref:Pseudouridine synthase n=1 Tax=Sphingomonas agrestis TaxID=3080540 RepID=A0ABU3Y6K9_9SPHN|nr:RluA family pseudouridine synthase [Sphingomonas sp. HF-S4]MDV3457025.1 RluA family pseudouridine synthase [Sphingomonas sp. HF-S4]
MDRGVTTLEARIAEAADGWRLDRALADALPTLSRERVKALISSGAVTGPAGLIRDPAKKAPGGALFQIAVPVPAPAHNEAQDIALNVVFEDEHLIVIDKQAGLVVHPAAGNLDGTLVNALLHHCDGSLSGIGGVARPGIVHRIDKDTSGLMVAAKTDRAHVGLARQFKDHSIDRRYKAIVNGHLRTLQGSVDAPLARSPANRKKMAIQPHGKRAVTHWRQLGGASQADGKNRDSSQVRQLLDASFVECRLETGRTHQVRVHMASIGHPLVGDPVYGSARKAHREILETLDFRRQALHAAHLGFIHPVKSHALAFDSEMPADMQELFNKLIV